MSQSPRGPHAARGPQLTRGPLPAAIYWRRRLVALGAVVALVALVVVPIRLVTGGGQMNIVEMKSSYELKSGQTGYNGIDDYEYTEGLGHLDACNGHFGPTPDFPQGIYHYHTTYNRVFSFKG